MIVIVCVYWCYYVICNYLFYDIYYLLLLINIYILLIDIHWMIYTILYYYRWNLYNCYDDYIYIIVIMMIVI